MGLIFLTPIVPEEVALGLDQEPVRFAMVHHVLKGSRPSRADAM